MDEVEDDSVHLVVTSPPYNVGKEYELDTTFDDWLDLMKTVLGECLRVLVSGGRLAVNVANIMRTPYIPLSYHVTDIALKLGFLMRGMIIWWKGVSGGTSTAWGSWKSASNPVLRDEQEYILVFCKESFKLTPKGEDTISDSEFVQNSRTIWKIKTASAKKLGHPTPFPVTLPYRLIEFYTYKENIVLDPFIGSGTTAIASLKANRHFIGYELDPEYHEIAKKRVRAYQEQKRIPQYFAKNDNKNKINNTLSFSKKPSF